jgi:tRNA A-37 threonylcarbamoyl transferase component Bud32
LDQANADTGAEYLFQLLRVADVSLTAVVVLQPAQYRKKASPGSPSSQEPDTPATTVADDLDDMDSCNCDDDPDLGGLTLHATGDADANPTAPSQAELDSAQPAAESSTSVCSTAQSASPPPPSIVEPITYTWNGVPLKKVEPLFEEDATGANRAASARLMFSGHFYVPTGGAKQKYECVVKTAMDVENEAPSAENIASIKREYEVYSLLRDGTGKNNQNGCIICHSVDPLYSYLVLERYGRDLRALLEVPIKSPSAVVEAIATAVAALHEHGVMHGDIKPQNILFQYDHVTGYIMKLCDLDCAHLVGQSVPASKLGTTGYFAPELYSARNDGESITTAIELDLFALGIVLWQVLESSIRSPLPHEAAPGGGLALCYSDQNFLWGRLEVGVSVAAFRDVLRGLTKLEPQLRTSTRQLCISLQKLAQPYLHEQLQRAIDENTRLLRDKAFLETNVGAQLGQMRQDIGAIHNDLKVKLREMTDMLHTVIDGTHDIPTLAVILPVIAPKSLFQSVRTMHLLKHRYRLYFLCSYTHKIAPCGEGGRGYEISVTQEWVKAAAPVLRTGLLLLKLGLMAGGLPLPVPDLLTPLLNDVTKHSRYLNAALRLVENPAGDKEPNELELKKLANAFTSAEGIDLRTQHGVGDTGAVLKENTLKAYESIQRVFAVKNTSIAETCGLRKVTYKGKTAWILDDDSTERQFKESLMH